MSQWFPPIDWDTAKVVGVLAFWIALWVGGVIYVWRNPDKK